MNKVGFIDGSIKKPDESDVDFPKWKRADYLVSSWIISSIKGEIGDDFDYAETAYDLWKDVKERFGQTNGPLIFQIRKEIANLNQANLSILSYYGKIQRLWEDMAIVKCTPTCTCGALAKCTCEYVKRVEEAESQEKVMQFLLGPNAGYDSTVVNVLNMDPIPNINRTYAIVQQIEAQKEVSQAQETQIESAALTVQKQSRNWDVGANNKYGSSSKGDWKKDKAARFCDYCKMKGHNIDQCFKKIGYPEWYTSLKQKKSGSGGFKVAANAIVDPNDTPLDDTSGADEDMMNAICQEVWKAMKIKQGTPDKNSSFAGTSEDQINKVKSYSDSDWNACQFSSRSLSSYAIFPGDHLVSWKTKKQPTVSKSSSTEAEYRSLFATTSELTWIQGLLQDLRINIKLPISIKCDNTSLVHLTYNPMFHEKTKHLKREVHYVREQVEAGILAVQYIPSTDQLADVLTKPLLSGQHRSLSSQLGLASLSSASATTTKD